MAATGEQVEGVDNSLAAIQARLAALQEPLRTLMGKALDLFDDVYEQAPHPREADDSPVYRTWTVNFCPVERVPVGRELTVVLGSGRWVRVFRTTESAPDVYPRQRLWLWRPEGAHSRKTDIFRTHDPRREEIPYNIETADYNKEGTCVDLVGSAYGGQEPFIAEADMALDDAREVADRHGLVVPRG